MNNLQDLISTISLLIATGSLILSVIVNKQTTEKYKQETDWKFELEYNDFLYSVNHLYELTANLEESKKDYSNDEINESEHIETLENNIYKITIEVAYLLNKTTDYVGGIMPKAIDEDISDIKVPLRYVSPLNEIEELADKYSRSRIEDSLEILEENAINLCERIKNTFDELDKHLYLN